MRLCNATQSSVSNTLSHFTGIQVKFDTIQNAAVIGCISFRICDTVPKNIPNVYKKYFQYKKKFNSQQENINMMTCIYTRNKRAASNILATSYQLLQTYVEFP